MWLWCKLLCIGYFLRLALRRRGCEVIRQYKLDNDEIRRRAAAAGLTMAALCAAVGLPARSYYNQAAGGVRADLAVALALADALGVGDVREILAPVAPGDLLLPFRLSGSIRRPIVGAGLAEEGAGNV